MYLQLAENETTIPNMYQPIETNQGTLYVRPDLLSAPALKVAAPAAKAMTGAAVKKAVPGLVKTATAAVPGGAAAGIALDLGKKLITGAIAKRKEKKEAAAAADIKAQEAAAAAASAAAIDSEATKKRNRMYLIGGGILGAGLLVYLLTRKK
jgi:cell wall-associated NlpC family hydrolase